MYIHVCLKGKIKHDFMVFYNNILTSILIVFAGELHVKEL